MCTSSTGMYCDSKFNQCKTFSGEYGVGFLSISSNICATYDALMIKNAKRCQDGSKAIRFSQEKVNYYYGSRSQPAGCLVGPAGIQFNSETSSHTCSSSVNCICMVLAPLCTNTDATIKNDAKCVCGNIGCTGENLFCDEGSPTTQTRCGVGPACSITDGSAPNKYACRCGEEFCSSTSIGGTSAKGLYCVLKLPTIKNSKCYKVPMCLVRDGSSENSENCLCGNVECSLDVGGLYCYAATSSCSASEAGAVKGTYDCADDDDLTNDDDDTCYLSAPLCSNTLGEGENSNICTCGKKTCTSSTGLYCYSSGSLCSNSSIPNCMYTGGRRENKHPCYCGKTAHCNDANSTCYADLNQCSKSSSLTYHIFKLRDFGSCHDDFNWTPIESTELCSDAAQVLELDGSPASSQASRNVPLDCSHRNGNAYPHLISNSYTGTNTLDCGATDSLCLCTFSAEACENRDGTVKNSKSCICGYARCDLVTGLHCVSSLNSCRKACSPGQFRNNIRVTPTCSNCSTKGYYCPAGATVSDTQFPCPPGKYSDKIRISNVTQCSFCPDGKYSPTPGAGDVSECNACLRGTTLVSHSPLTCQTCPEGFYQPEIPLTIDMVCTVCPEGFFSADSNGEIDVCASDQSSLIAAQRDDIEDCKPCSPGRVWALDDDGLTPTCRVCSGGRYMSVMDASARQCKLCPRNTFLNDHQGSKDRHGK